MMEDWNNERKKLEETPSLQSSIIKSDAYMLLNRHIFTFLKSNSHHTKCFILLFPCSTDIPD